MPSIWNTAQQITNLLGAHTENERHRILSAISLLTLEVPPTVAATATAETKSDELLTVSEAAKTSGVAVGVIYDRIKRGKLEAKTRDGRKMVPREALSNYRRRA